MYIQIGRSFSLSKASCGKTLVKPYAANTPVTNFPVHTSSMPSVAPSLNPNRNFLSRSIRSEYAYSTPLHHHHHTAVLSDRPSHKFKQFAPMFLIKTRLLTITFSVSFKFFMSLCDPCPSSFYVTVWTLLDSIVCFGALFRLPQDPLRTGWCP